jgi:hypothetical protein
VLEPQAPVLDDWYAPFFYEDRQNLFYVTTTATPVRIPESNRFGVDSPQTESKLTIPQLALAPADVVASTNGNVISRTISGTETVRFGEQEIGPSGSVVKRR